VRACHVGSVDSPPVAPPKRKTTGRVTAKGTRPGDPPRSAGASSGSSGSGGVAASSRYTPPVPRELRESPKWLPVLMFILIGLGGLIILLRYLVWPDSNLPVLVGLALLLAGLYTATKWH